jgi:hypothetical protein
MGAVDGWVQHLANTLSTLRTAALEQLLLTETLVAKHARSQMPAQPAPEASRAPSGYALLLQGEERQRRTTLGWWARFQRADGVLPGLARLAVAGGIVAVVLGVGASSSMATLTVYNGLGTQIQVRVDGEQLRLAAFDHLQLSVVSQRRLHVETRSADGELIESFDSDELGTGAEGVYNVAAASPLVEWTNTYGNAGPVPDRQLNAPRWLLSHADVLFTRPPESISTKSGGGTRSVLEGLGQYAPGQQLALLADDKERLRLIALHARWDDTAKEHTDDWLTMAGQGGRTDILAARLRQAPEDVTLLRVEQEIAGAGRTPEFCARYDALSARKPQSADLKYIALRCPQDSPDGDRQMLAAHQRWPDNPWLAYAAAYTHMQDAHPESAIPELNLVRSRLPQMAPLATLHLARLHRLARDGQDISSLAATSGQLRSLLEMERGEGKDDGPGQAYAKLQRGLLGQALNNSAGNEWQKAQISWLVAASDGAGADAVKRALAQPADKGIDGATALLGVALALKNGADPKPYVDISAKVYHRYHAPVMAFLNALNQGQSPAAAEALLGRIPLEARAYAYSAGIVLVGAKAPPSWRQFSQRVLFASEHPYFKA